MPERSRTPFVLIGSGAVVMALAAAWFWLRPQPDAATSTASGRHADEARGQGSRRSELSGATTKPYPAARHGVLRGAVTTLDGEGIPDARVCARPSGGLAGALSIRCVRSESDGRYRLDALTPGLHDVTAVAATYRPRAARAVAVRAGDERRVDLTLLDGGARVRGRVLDLSGGPIEGALVTIAGDQLRGDAPDVRGLAFTDAEGRFATWASPGRIRVTASAESYSRRSLFSAAPGPTIELYLVPESTLVGTVVNAETGAPIPDVPVSPGIDGGGAFMSFVDTTRGWATTDTRGEFRIAGLKPGPYQPLVASGRWRGHALTTVRLGLGEISTPIEIRVTPAAVVHAQVVDANSGAPTCGGGSVTTSVAPFQTRRADIDADGGVELGGLGDGDYKVSIHCEGRATIKKAASFTIQDGAVAGGEDVLRWAVDAGRAVRGVVEDGEGRPLAGATVTASAVGTARGRPFKPVSEATGKDGAFAVAGLRPGEYELNLGGSAAPRLREPIVVELRDRDVDDVRIRAPSPAVIEGRVRDGAGEPATRVTVTAYGADAWWDTISDDEGRYSLPQLGPDRYRVVALDGRWNLEVAEESVELGEGAREEVDLVLAARGGVIRGHVRDSGGTPLGDAFISVERQPGALDQAPPRGRLTYADAPGRPVLTDLDGAFEITGLPDGLYTIRARQRQGGEALQHDVQPGASLELVVADVGTLSGVVVAPGAVAVTDFSITATLGDGRFEFRDRWRGGTGDWRLEDIPPGAYTLRAESEVGGGSLSVALDPGASVGDLRIELTAQADEG